MREVEIETDPMKSLIKQQMLMVREYRASAHYNHSDPVKNLLGTSTENKHKL